jgi:FkbM family methyltransferase
MDLAFAVTRSAMRAIPNGLPGKTRLARLALRSFLLNEPACLPDAFGNKLHLPSLKEPIAIGLFAFGVYEGDTLSAILRHLPPRGVFVDIGANVGALTLPVAAQRGAARIICIEADPKIASLLQRNVTENDRPNVIIVQCIAGPTQSEMQFYPAPAEKFGMGSLGPQFDAAPITLQQRAVDDVLDELGVGNIDVIKLDVEGAELGALRGLRRRLVSASAPVVIFEFADWAEKRIGGQVAGDAQRLLLSLGYALFRLGARGAPGERLRSPTTAGSAMLLAFPPRAGA